MKDLGWVGLPGGEEVLYLASCLALGGYYHLEPEGQPLFACHWNGINLKYKLRSPFACVADGVMGSETIGAQGRWDLVQRFGFVNDKIIYYELELRNGTDPKNARMLELQLEINSLWELLKGWLEKNHLLSHTLDAMSFAPSFTEGPEPELEEKASGLEHLIHPRS